MPLYEEKLINPLAVRFTQEHIRTTFRDGREVEPTVDEIEVQPGHGEYDVILRAPFPHIEVIRWSPPSYLRYSSEEDEASDPAASGSEGPARDHHWYTLDNRRLYCLQKVAVSLLPKRAAAVVETLYADTGSVWRKYDSETSGWSVSISRSTKCAPIGRWSWKEQVIPRGVSTVEELYKAHEAMRAVKRDDQKTTVDELQDTQQGSIVDRLTDALRRAEEHCKGTANGGTAAESRKPPSSEAGCPTPSTTDLDSSDDESEREATAATSAEATPRRTRPTSAASKRRQGAAKSEAVAAAAAEKERAPSSDPVAALRSCLEGCKWMGRRGDSYELTHTGGATWTCLRKDKTGSKKFTVSYDKQEGIVWWGTDKAYYFDASAADPDCEEIAWYAAADWYMQKARFVWKLAEPRCKQSPVDALAASAIKEIKEQLADPECDGRLWLPHWSGTYAAKLGSLRGFVESLPLEFVVKHAGGHRFKVSVVSGASAGESAPAAAAPDEPVADKADELADRAVREVKDQLAAPGSDGVVQLPTWNKVYRQHLGSLREFLEGRPDLFKVSGQGRGRFTVSLVRAKPEDGKPAPHGGAHRGSQKKQGARRQPA